MNISRNVVLALAGIFLGASAQAQVSYSGGTYSENFDSMGFTSPISYPLNWSGFRYAGSGAVQAWTPSATEGGTSSGGIYSVGAANASDRALGALGSGTTIGRFGVRISNTSGGMFNVVDVSGVTEQWRSGSSSAVTEKLEFEFSFNATGVNDGLATWTKYSALDVVELRNSVTANTALDGNDGANSAGFSSSITGIQWDSGSVLTLRWSDANDTGNDALLALDNFSLSASSVTPVPEPSTWALFGAGLIGMGFVVRRKNK